VDAWFRFEAPVNGYMSATAASWSDRLVFTTLAVPVFAEVGNGVDRQLANHAIVYGQTIGFQLLLDVGVKHAVRRARPYTHNCDPRVEEFRCSQGAEANLSFYSGHSSTAFAAALSGSYLFAAKTDDAWSRRIVWFSELGFAAATAHLRVRAGMHYYSDVIVGTLVGTAFGLAVPYLHGERYRPDASEYGAAAAGFAVGALAPLFVRTTDVRLEWGGREITTLHVGPWIPPGGAGVSVTGLL
jgi:membrane-associated phospholipid phosphatase